MAPRLASIEPADVVAPAALEARGVYRTFIVDGREVEALRNVSFEIAQGSFTSIVGASGCGKSTLLRLFAGLDEPDGGKLLVDGEAVTGPSLDRGMLFQDHRLLPWLTVQRNVLLGMHKQLDGERAKARVAADLLKLVGLEGFEAAFPHQLSGGMSQRAAIARSLAPKPRVLLLDEPLGALDSLTRSQLQGELLRIWQHERITMLMVTHDVEEAVFLSEHIIVMEPRPGRIAKIIDVPLAKPRRRDDPAFARIKGEVLAMLGAGL